ncbi:hypothetical protein RND81_03G040500 [Saponaria officinalis]|uniref:Uncharacterized protein n=1 Tax=Saponaria officinalis TaxID=3572 RepID=A0AAW1M7F9_SAPOF
MLLMISAPYVILPIRILPSPLFPFLSFLKTKSDHLTTTIHFTQRPSTSLSSPTSFSFSRKLDHHRASPDHFHLHRKKTIRSPDFVVLAAKSSPSSVRSLSPRRLLPSFTPVTVIILYYFLPADSSLPRLGRRRLFNLFSSRRNTPHRRCSSLFPAVSPFLSILRSC